MVENAGNTFRQRLCSGERLFGTIVSMATPEVPEILSAAGFDWLFIDSEHAPLSDDAIRLLILAAAQTPCLVRVPALDEAAIKKALDAGAAGIIVPQVNTAAQAERAASYARYPPLGQRGVGISRAQHYGFGVQEYIDQANDHVAVVVQAEHWQAVDNIESIAATAGIDAVFVGPYDLSASLGKAGKVADASVTAAVDRITRACLQARVRLGVFGASAPAVRPYISAGYTLIATGTDTLFLGQNARDTLATLKA